LVEEAEAAAISAAAGTLVEAVEVEETLVEAAAEAAAISKRMTKSEG
jgi:hypothetical protein